MFHDDSKRFRNNLVDQTFPKVDQFSHNQLNILSKFMIDIDVFSLKPIMFASQGTTYI